MKIKLNEKISMDLQEFLRSKLLIQANSGGGKSWTVRRIIEQSHGLVQQIIIDPEGEYGNLREKYDFILAGKDGDIPADPRHAEMLARKLLEHNASAIIDLYELHPQERKHFVKLFLNAMLNAPKALQHPCMIVVDEAHVFAPEAGQAESLDAMIGLAATGRKRQFSAIFATQRISKLHKDVAAECNNKLVGRTGLDIDQKRAGDDLGFRTNEQRHELRQLQSGEFYAYGPAISRDVIKFKIGDVNVKPPKNQVFNITKPNAKIKEILSKLGDIPVEAKKETETIQFLKAENAELKIQNRNLLKNPFQKDLTSEEILKLARPYLDAQDKEYKNALHDVQEQFRQNVIFTEALFRDIQKIQEISMRTQTMPKIEIHEIPIRYSITEKRPITKELIITNLPNVKKVIKESFGTDTKPLRAGAMKMMNWIAGASNGLSKQRLATLSGFSVSGGTFNTYISELKRNGWVTGGDILTITQEGFDNSQPEEIPSGDDLLRLWKVKFRAGAGNILQFVYDNKSVSKEKVGEALGFDITGGTFNTYLSELRRNGLILVEGNNIKISEEF